MSSAVVGSSSSEQRRLLGERPREHRPLLLASAQRSQRPAREGDQLELGERAVGRLEVARALAAERADVRRSPEQDVVAHDASRTGGAATAARRRAVARPRVGRAPRPRRRRSGSSRRTARGRRLRAGACSCRRRSARSAVSHSPRATSASTPSTTSVPPSVTETPLEAQGRHVKLRLVRSTIGEERGAEERRHDADRQLGRRHDRAGEDVGQHEEPAADEQRERHDQPVARAADEPDRVRDDDPDEADQAADRDRRRRSDRREHDDQRAASG